MNEGIDRRDFLISTAAAAGLGMIAPVAPAEAQGAAAAARVVAAAGSVDARAQRLNDALDVENLMGKYVPLYHAGYYDEIESMFAIRQRDVKVEIRGTGVWRGAAAVHKAVVLIPQRVDDDFDAATRKQFPNIRLERRSGRQFEMPLTSPIIRVAGDGRTAKGIWAGFGVQTAVRPDGKVDTYMAATRYAVDFIREGDDWKFWHFQIVPVFFTPYGKNWVETARNPEPVPAYLKTGELAPNASSAPSAHTNDPRLPVRYATFNDTFSY